MIYYFGPLAAIETIQETPWIRQSLDGLSGITKTSQDQEAPEGCQKMNHAEALILSRSPAYEPEEGA